MNEKHSETSDIHRSRNKSQNLLRTVPVRNCEVKPCIVLPLLFPFLYLFLSLFTEGYCVGRDFVTTMPRDSAQVSLGVQISRRRRRAA